MPRQVVSPRMRGFICTNAHPVGCAVNIRRQVEAVSPGGQSLGNVLVLGSSTGYGLASLITALFGYGADVLGVCFERPPVGTRTASAGWYNLVELHWQAKQARRRLRTVNGDAFSHELKDQVVGELSRHFGPIDMLVYSLASPRRKDPDSDTIWNSVLKPVGQPYGGKHIELKDETVTTVEIEPATSEEIDATVRVMGGEDWELWVRRLAESGLLAEGFRTVAYSYIGPEVTWPIYRSGTIGQAKEHLEQTADRLQDLLSDDCGGEAWVSVNKAAVTQASAVIPAVPLYKSLLYRVMKEAGTHEMPIDQAIRLFRDHIGPGRTPTLDDRRRIRMDDLELANEIQQRVHELWQIVDTDNLSEISDWLGFKREFRQLFGFEVDGVDYDATAQTELLIPSTLY